RSTSPETGVPSRPYGGPIILSTSNHNFLSYNGAAVSGTIFVENIGSAAQQFSITSTDISPLVATPLVCSVSGGGTCTFNVTYPYHEPLDPTLTPAISPINFRVVDASGNSDAI